MTIQNGKGIILTQKHQRKLERKRLDLKRNIHLQVMQSGSSGKCRILSRMDEELFALEFMEWTGEIVDTEGTHLAIGGKALRAAMQKNRRYQNFYKIFLLWRHLRGAFLHPFPLLLP